MTPRLLQPLRLVLLTLALVTLAAAPASAHSELLESTPADGERLTVAPTEIELVFGEDVQQQGGAILVTGTDGVRYDRPSSFATSDNVATVRLTPASSAPGRYLVAYRIVSADGHVVDGSFGYRVLETGGSDAEDPESLDPSATPLGGAPTDPGAGDESGVGVVWVLGLGAIGLALLAALIAVAVRGRRGLD